MRMILCTILVLVFWTTPAGVGAVETAARITDREIIERLTRLEEGQKHLTEALAQLRHDMNVQFGRIDAQFDRIDAHFNRIDAQFGRMFNLILGLVGAFAAIVASTIGFAIWDRRTMIRPFETKIQQVEAELAHNRQGLHALLDTLRALSETDDRVAAVLRRFNLL